MTREIKFRAWNKTNKFMTTSFSVTSEGKIIQIRTLEGDKGVIQEKPRYILMQYTGLKDMNGKEIYEGDIVEYISGNRRLLGEVLDIDEYGVQIWNDNIRDKFTRHDNKDEMIGLRSENAKGPLMDEDDHELDCNEVEVIGNIHENREFLKPEENA